VDGEAVFVLPPVLNLRQGPSTSTPVLRRLQRGQELKVLEQKEGWNRVRGEGGAEGWVDADFVGSAAEVRARFEAEVRARRSAGSVRRVPDVSTKGKDALSGPGPAPGRPPRELTVDGLLRGFPDEMTVEALEPLDGVPRAMGVAAEGQVVAEFWGAPDRLDRASVTVTVLKVSDEELDRNAGLALAFVKNGMPTLDRDRTWMTDRLKLLSSKDTGEGELKAGGRRVAFEFLKPLGAVRILVEPVGPGGASSPSGS
jgi:hypothetical protein